MQCKKKILEGAVSKLFFDDLTWNDSVMSFLLIGVYTIYLDTFLVIGMQSKRFNFSHFIIHILLTYHTHIPQ